MPDSAAIGPRLAPGELTRSSAPEQFAFSTIDDLEPLRGVPSQKRAIEVLQLGVAIPHPNYSVLIVGEPRTGRLSFIERYSQAEGERVATSSD